MKNQKFDIGPIIMTPDRVMDSLIVDYIIQAANGNGKVIILRGASREALAFQVMEESQIIKPN